MKTVVDDSRPPAGQVGSRKHGGIGSRARNLTADKQRLGLGRKPRRVPRFAYEGPGIPRAHEVEEPCGRTPVKRKRWGQLDEEWAAPASQPRGFFKEADKGRMGAPQLLVVRDDARQLDGKPKRARSRPGPLPVGCAGMRTVE